MASTLKGSPTVPLGHSFRVLSRVFMLSAGPSDTAVIERRRFQRHSAVPTVQHVDFRAIGKAPKRDS